MLTFSVNTKALQEMQDVSEKFLDLKEKYGAEKAHEIAINDFIDESGVGLKEYRQKGVCTGVMNTFRYDQNTATNKAPYTLKEDLSYYGNESSIEEVVDDYDSFVDRIEVNNFLDTLFGEEGSDYFSVKKGVNILTKIRLTYLENSHNKDDIKCYLQEYSEYLNYKHFTEINQKQFVQELLIRLEEYYNDTDNFIFTELHPIVQPRLVSTAS